MEFVIITTVRNQSLRMFDWIDYHSKIGFDTFLIFDDKSEDNTINEINKAKELLHNIKIVILESELQGELGPGGPYSYTYGNDTNSIDARRWRNFIKANNYVKSVNPNAICSFIDVDEFFASDYNFKQSVIDFLKINNCQQILVMNVDIKNDYILEKDFIKKNKFMRWNYQDIESHPVWKNRTKCIFISKYLDYCTDHHYLPINGRTFCCKDYERLRMYHFRIPNLPNSESINFVPDNYFDKFK